MTQKKTLKLPKLIGHRGVKDLCPENTLESIARAFEIGLNFVEIDVKISKDNVPILLHDDTLDRTTNGSGLAIDYDYEKIKKLDAGKFFYKENTNIFVPKLEDILSLCTNYNGNLNIELKPNKKFEKENVHQIYEIIKNINQIDIFFSSCRPSHLFIHSYNISSLSLHICHRCRKRLKNRPYYIAQSMAQTFK